MRVFLVLLCLVSVLAALQGCDEDGVPVESEWVVLNPSSSRFVGLVQIVETVVETRGTNRAEVVLQGTVTNFGPDLEDARVDMLAADVATRLDGTTLYLDERVVASVELGTLHRNRTLSINLRWTHSTMTPLRIRSRFTPTSAD